MLFRSGGFSDPLIECENKDCKNRRHRVDHLVGDDVYQVVLKRLKDPKILESLNSRTAEELKEDTVLTQAPKGEIEFQTRKGIDERIQKFEDKTGVIMQTVLLENKIKCPSCGKVDWGMPRQFNMMFKTNIGATGDAASTTYLRPETAGGMFVNYKNVVDSFHPKLPFGLAQIGNGSVPHRSTG